MSACVRNVWVERNGRRYRVAVSGAGQPLGLYLDRRALDMDGRIGKPIVAEVMAKWEEGRPLRRAMYEIACGVTEGRRLQRRRLRDAAPDLLAALDDLLAFHDHTHPRHDALFEGFQEDCVAAEVAPKASDLLAGLQSAARAARAKATGGDA